MRTCGCGCGIEIHGAPTRRFVDDAHRKRASRAELNGLSDLSDPDAPLAEPGRVRAGLEEWLDDRPNLPESLVSAARVLADEVDQASDHSPLWGRYSAVLALLQDSAKLTDAKREAQFARSLREIQTGCHEPTHRLAPSHCAFCCNGRARECVGGRHAWTGYRDPRQGVPLCKHCGTYAPSGTPVPTPGWDTP